MSPRQMMLSASYRGGNRGLYFSDWGVALEHRAGSSTWPFWLFCSVRFHWPNQHYCTWVEWSEPRSASLCHVLLVRGRERRAARSSYCGPWTSWGFPALPWFLTVIRSKLCSLLLGSSRLDCLFSAGCVSAFDGLWQASQIVLDDSTSVKIKRSSF